VEEEFVIPPEFREEVVQEEIDNNRKASTGTATISGLSYSWAPKKLTISGESRAIRNEYESIRRTLMKSPTFAKFVVLIKQSPSGRELDLGALLEAIEESAPVKADVCFSLPMLFYGKVDDRTMDYPALERFLSGWGRRRLVSRNNSPGDIVVLEDKGRRNEPTHAYLQLTPALALEKRGSGAILIRPSTAVAEDYRWYMKHSADLKGNENVYKERYRDPLLLRVYAPK